MKHIVIIGAGLSGIYAATLLQQHYRVTILEARDRIGGRVLTLEGFDMGPSWVWSHQHAILRLLQENGVGLFAQYTQGLALYDTPSGVEYFTPPPSAPSGRIQGGVITLVNKLAGRLKPESIRLNSAVTSIQEQASHLVVKTQEQRYEADIVLNTLPPRLAVDSIAYRPGLDTALSRELSSIPTWMGHSAKCTIEFDKPFWREKGLSGFGFSPLGPLGELHDACTDKAALFGFFNSQVENRNEKAVRLQMQRLFGDDAKRIRNIYITDWTKERFTSVRADHRALAAHPDYGHSAEAYDGKLIFMGSESSRHEGGYLEGAVISAKSTAEKLLEKLL